MKVNAVVAADTLPCTATQVTFSPVLEEAFVTGVDPACTTTESVIHGYSAATQALITPLQINSAVVPLNGGVLSDGSKLFFGTFDSTNGGQLHRIDLTSGTEDSISPVPARAVAGSLTLIPSLVAVVPK
jgi:hypothetical protein